MDIIDRDYEAGLQELCNSKSKIDNEWCKTQHFDQIKL